MDESSAKWFADLGMDEYNFMIHEGYTAQNITTTLGGVFKQYESYSSTSNNSETSFERPLPKLEVKNSGSKSGVTDHVSPKPSSDSSSSHILYFENANLSPSPLSKAHQKFPSGFDSATPNKRKAEEAVGFEKKKPCSMTRTPSHAQDHTLAERKRREKLSQRFIALSSVLPGLKKMDKASILGDAIKYVKQLQESVKLLEEQTKKRTVESVVFVKKSQLQVSSDDETSNSSCHENFDSRCSGGEPLPEIEARVSEKDVLIRIHCENKKGYVVKILSELENLKLSVVTSSVLPFGKSTQDITIIAQMNDEFDMTVIDLAKNLRVALLKFM